MHQLNYLKRLSSFFYQSLIDLQCFILFSIKLQTTALLPGIFAQKTLKKIGKDTRTCFKISNQQNELLSKANIPSIHVRRLKTMAIDIFKFRYEMAPPVLSYFVRL